MRRPGRHRSAKKQMLLIVNPYATTVSDRLAYVRLRVFGDLQPDTFTVPRERQTKAK